MSLKRPLLKKVKATLLYLLDTVGGMVGLPPLYVKIAGLKDDVAYMSMKPEELALYFSKHPKQYLGGWKNAAPARGLALVGGYNPIDYVSNATVRISFLFLNPIPLY